MVDLRDVVDGTVGQGKADSHSDSGSEWSMDEADIESLLETRVALDLMDPHASRATPAVRTLAAPAETSMAMMSAPASRGRGGRRGGGADGAEGGMPWPGS